MSILRYKQKVLAQGGVLMGGGGKGGGGGAPAQTTGQSNQYTSLSPWAQPYVTSILGAGQSQVFQTDPTTGEITGILPYQAYGSYNPQGGQYGMSASDQAAANAAVAGFTPLQQQAFTGAGNLQVPGQYGAATGAAGAGTMQALGAGQQYAQQATNPYAMQAYMNPYVQASLQPQLNLIAQQGNIAAQQAASQATGSGAFGGSRSALAQNLAQQNALLAQQQAIGQGYNTAFQQAQQAQQYGAGLGLQGAQAGIAGAGQLANIGGQQLAAQQGILGLQSQYGGMQQQQAQNVINAAMANYQTAQQYPMTQLNQLKGLISGIPVSDVTTTQQQAQPAMATQLAGLGTAGVAGLALANQASKAKGGTVKSYADGGITDAINRKALLSPSSISPQQLQRSTQDGAISPAVSGIAQAIQLSDKVKAQNAAAAQQGMPQGTVVGDLEKQSEQMDQAEMIPKAMAVLKRKRDEALEAGRMDLARRYEAELQQLAQMVSGEQAPAEVSAPAPTGIEQLASAPQEQAPQPEQPQQPQMMAKGGIAALLAEDEQYADADEAEDAELRQLYGTGAENDFTQAIMPAARQSGTTHPSAGITISFDKDTSPVPTGHKYAQELISEAKKQGRDPNVLLKMLQKETGGLEHPETARSKAGALGIAQFMPATAKQYGIDPTDPKQAIPAMVKHFGYLEDKFGDPKLAMAAYNWGEGNVKKWLKQGADPRKLPQETRQYASMAAGGIASIKHYDGQDGSLVSSSWDDNTPVPVMAPAAANLVSQGTVANRDAYRNAPAGVAAIPTQEQQVSQQITDAVDSAKPMAPIKASSESYSFDDIAKEIMDDLKKRKEESKSQREQNNLLALAQLGLGMAASRNIHPLGAIAEGGQQAIGALAQFRKQESEEAKDIAAQQLGLFKYQGAQKTAQAQLEESKRYHDILAGTKPSEEEKRRATAEKLYGEQVKDIEKQEAAALKAAGTETLDPDLQQQFQNKKIALRRQIYASQHLSPAEVADITPIPKRIDTLKPSIIQKTMPTSMGGLSAQDLEAVKWANEHPYDARAAQIKQRLGL